MPRVSNDWTYYVLPGGVARKKNGTIEIRDPKTENWIAIADSAQLLETERMISQDGQRVKERDANRAFNRFKEGARTQ